MRSIAAIRLELVTTRVLVWVAQTGRDAELTPEAHLYFFDRYDRLAEHHRRHGRHARAAQLQAKADDHYRRGGGNGPPYAAAMAMPRPRAWFTADAVAPQRHVGGSDDAA